MFKGNEYQITIPLLKEFTDTVDKYFLIRVVLKVLISLVGLRHLPLGHWDSVEVPCHGDVP